MAAEIWTIGIPDPLRGGEVAKRLEDEGYDGIVVVDSQCLAPDSFVGLTVMAQATTTLGIGTGVANPVTRHPAALAAAAAAVNVVSANGDSGGRMVLGIGRGDSALFHIGQEPAPLREFKPFLADLCKYVRGEIVDQDGTPSSLRWFKNWPQKHHVPVDVACTGPKIIQYAATVADRITFAVGVNPDRIRWGIDLARQARTDAGLNPDDLRFGAYVQCAAHPDTDKAVALVRGTAGTFAHFSGMEGSTGEGQTAEDRAQFESVHENYERKKHTMATARHAQALDDDFIRRFAAVGPADEVIARLQSVVDEGVDRLVFTFPSRDTNVDDQKIAKTLFADEVMPALHA
ncbi:MAG: 5,10-methylenetetrahydromethanopterin reductase [Candidatus Poriferisodalaceae bacterium]|jgi:5,10-methylenetetrahydromethanopterin reductase